MVPSHAARVVDPLNNIGVLSLRGPPRQEALEVLRRDHLAIVRGLSGIDYSGESIDRTYTPRGARNPLAPRLVTVYRK